MISKYELIDAEKAWYPIRLMCEWIEVSRSGFYDWLTRATSATAARRRELEVMIRYVFDASDSTYGYRRVHAELRAGQVRCSPEFVRSVMRDLGLYPCQPKPFRPTTTEAGDTGEIPDLVKRNFTAEVPGTKLVGDITYIRTDHGFAYLATVIDCCTRECIGYAIADHMRADLVCEALATAARNYPLAENFVTHSDRGAQYTSEPVRESSKGPRRATFDGPHRQLLR